MTKSYLEQFTNENIEKYLLNKKNVPLLEEILYNELVKFERLLDLKKSGKLLFGQIPKNRELPDLLEKIKNKTDSFLEVADIENCDIAYRSLFNKEAKEKLKKVKRNASSYLKVYFTGGLGAIFLTLSFGAGAAVSPVVFMAPVVFLGAYLIDSSMLYLKKVSQLAKDKSNHYVQNYKFIHLKKNTVDSLISTIAHEYVHHVQYEKLDSSFLYNHNSFSYFAEGYADYTAMHIAKHYSDKNKDLAFLYQKLGNTVFHLNTIYKWLCENLGIEENKNLNCDAFFAKSVKNNIRYGKLPNEYSFGDAFFAINEAKHGSKIYADIMKERFILK
jgi:uncharacterized protein YjaZ